MRIIKIILQLLRFGYLYRKLFPPTEITKTTPAKATTKEDFKAAVIVQESSVEPPAPPVLQQHLPRYHWCLDPGHGSLSAGKRSPILPGYNRRLFEYEINRDVLARITLQLQEIGVQYFVTVPEVEIGNELQLRVKRANDLQTTLPKIFVSIHHNAGPAKDINSFTNDSVSGIETFYAQGGVMGKRIAEVFQRHLLVNTRMKNRGSKPANFYVLTRTIMPAVLTEGGFYNNRYEVMELMKGEVRQALANAHVAAILEIEKYGI